MFHGNVNTWSYADGHADGHLWRDQNVINVGLQSAKGNGGNVSFVAGSPDYNFIYSNYRFPGWEP
jgi:hypothetical protein